MAVRERIRKELSDLAQEGGKLVLEFQKDKAFNHGNFSPQYQAWYTRALRVVATLAPDRLKEFAGYYEPDPKRKGVDVISYRIYDFLSGIAPNKNRYTGEIPYDHEQVAQVAVYNQVTILKSLASRIDDVLSDIEGRIATELQDAGLVAARELMKATPRAGGALAGVVLEDHLQRTARARNVRVSKKDPTIGDLNDPLKAADVYDQATWRRIQYLADLRNLCAHKKAQEPKPEQVTDLIDGVAWVLANVS